MEKNVRLRNRTRETVEVRYHNGGAVMLSPGDEIYVAKLSDIANLNQVTNKLEIKKLILG